MVLPKKIDTHHHFVPPAFEDGMLLFHTSIACLNPSLALNAAPGGDPSGWILPKWSPSTSQNIMEEVGTKTAIFSVTAPGPGIVKGAASRDLARKINTYGAQLRNQQPERFGFFASVPDLWDDLEGALGEIQHALDHLQADGIVLMTRYGDGNYYLGHEKFKKVWELLDQRRAVVFIHPTHPADPTPVNSAMPAPLIDFPHETTRTALDLILSNTKREYSRCKVILSHSGGNLPWLSKRATLAASSVPNAKKPAKEIVEDAKSFYYDLALTDPNQLRLVLDFVPHEHLLFGSDFPYAPRQTVLSYSQDVDGYHMDDNLREKIYFKNALSLFPRLANSKAKF